jgi:hypothetical protein
MRRSALAIVLLGCGGGSDGAGSDAAGSGSGHNGTVAAHQMCVQETNRYRTTVPAPGTGAARAAVTESTQLESYADTGAMIDYSSSPHHHFITTNGGGISFAENECPHWPLSMTGGDLNQLVVACLAAFYGEGPGGGHYENMMGAYAELGCGIYENGSDVTIVQDYGP